MDENDGQAPASSRKRFPADHNYGTSYLYHSRSGSCGTCVQDGSGKLGHKTGCGRCQDVRHCRPYRGGGDGILESRIPDSRNLCGRCRCRSGDSLPSAEGSRTFEHLDCGRICRRMFLFRPCGISGNEDRHQGQCSHHPGCQDLFGQGPERLFPGRSSDGTRRGWSRRIWPEFPVHCFLPTIHGRQFCNRWRL